VEVTKDNLWIQLGIGECVALKGFIHLDSRDSVFSSCCTRSYLHTYTDYILTRRDVNDHG